MTEYDQDGTHPLERIAIALEKIEQTLRFLHPTIIKDSSMIGVADQCLPKNTYDVII